MSSKDKVKEMREKSQERRMEAAEKFADTLKDKLGDKVKVVAVWGSVPKGEHGYDSDIDTLVILDDTKLKQDVPKDARDKIRKKVTEAAKDTDEKDSLFSTSHSLQNSGTHFVKENHLQLKQLETDNRCTIQGCLCLQRDLSREERFQVPERQLRKG